LLRLAPVAADVNIAARAVAPAGAYPDVISGGGAVIVAAAPSIVISVPPPVATDPDVGGIWWRRLNLNLVRRGRIGGNDVGIGISRRRSSRGRRWRGRIDDGWGGFLTDNASGKAAEAKRGRSREQN
jgi:hypothetical protein